MSSASSPRVLPASPPARVAPDSTRSVLTSGGAVVIDAALSPPASIPPPAYRRTLPPRPGFALFRWQAELRRLQHGGGGGGTGRRDDLGGDPRARPAEGDDAQVTRRVVSVASHQRSHEEDAALSWAVRLRYAGLLVHPTRALESRHLRALVLYLLSLLVPYASLYLGATFLACHARDAVFGFIAAGACATAAVWLAVYVGGAGPFDCGMAEQEEDDGGERDAAGRRRLDAERRHKYLPARAPWLVACALVLLALASLLLAQPYARDVALACQLADTVSVNEAPSYSLAVEAYTGTIGVGRAMPSNVGTPPSDATSTRAFFAFRDGFVETQLTRGCNVSDTSGGAVVLNDASTRAFLGSPSRMLLVAPIFASFGDPFFLRRVPAWAVASFAWSDAEATGAQVVRDWSSAHRFAWTLTPVSRDYALAQTLVASVLAASNGRMEQLLGAPLLEWTSSSGLGDAAALGRSIYIGLAAFVFLLVWLPIAAWHVRWYLSMLDEEAAWQREVDKRGEARAVRVRSVSPRSADADEDGKSSNDAVELAELPSPSALLSPSLNGHTSAAGASHVYPSVSRSASLSSGAALLGGPVSSRPGSASAVSSAAGGAPPRRSSWKGGRFWPFGGGSINSISPDPVHHVTDASAASAPPVVVRTDAGEASAASTARMAQFEDTRRPSSSSSSSSASHLRGLSGGVPQLAGAPSAAFADASGGGSVSSRTPVSPKRAPSLTRPLSASAARRSGRSPHDPSNVTPPAQQPPPLPQASVSIHVEPEARARAAPGLGLHGQEYASEEEEEEGGEDDPQDESNPAQLPDSSALSAGGDARGLGLVNRSPKTKHLNSDNGVHSPATDPPRVTTTGGAQLFSAQPSASAASPPASSLPPLASPPRGPAHARQWQPEGSDEDEEDE